MVICGSYMFEFSVSMDMEKKNHTLQERRWQCSGEGSDTFMSFNNCQGIKN